MGIVGILITLLNIYSFVILVRVLMTWIPNLDYSNPIVDFILQITEPVLRPIRENMPQTGGLDFSPMIVLIAIMVVSRILAGM
ncbi:MAG: YggT family protein [Chloroflexota bacterium]